jgi:hypothetical protein
MLNKLSSEVSHGDKIKKRPPLCRVLQGFEPAKAGGFRPTGSALAPAYRVTGADIRTLVKGVGPKLGRQHHKHSRAQSSYTIY